MTACSIGVRVRGERTENRESFVRCSIDRGRLVQRLAALPVQVELALAHVRVDFNWYAGAFAALLGEPPDHPGSRGNAAAFRRSSAPR